MNTRNLGWTHTLQLRIRGQRRGGWSLVEVLVTASIASALMVFVLQTTLRMQHAYQRMNQVSQSRFDWWRLQRDLQNDVSRDGIGQLRLNDEMGTAVRSTEVEWSLVDRMIRYRCEPSGKRIVREEERSGQVVLREIYRMGESMELFWDLKSIRGTAYLILQANDEYASAAIRPRSITLPPGLSTLIVAVDSPSLTEAISP
ncbi:MAG: hypothetical protein O2931_16960 [Planctomycetota bacterium]|nr:hypothetical protein [Planctomycetota bacterium]MDA1180473.1 hypothetical protein [Planctomycetota bacterium]